MTVLGGERGLGLSQLAGIPLESTCPAPGGPCGPREPHHLRACPHDGYHHMQTGDIWGAANDPHTDTGEHAHGPRC